MAQRPSRRPHGFVATGPGFYVWEPTRPEATRAARELLPAQPERIRVAPAGKRPRTGSRRRR